ncbi:MAG: hypothetical protein K8L97_10540 [Anaerolineae bacterium]|nr:hypothetical protein [Anaerolineae bacterium]
MLVYFLLVLSLLFPTVQAQPDPVVTIAFNYVGDLYITDFESEPINLTNSEADEVMPVWSPDGQQIAFLFDPYAPSRGNYSLNVLTLDSGEIQMLADLELTTEAQMAWSPNGEFIAVTLDALFVVEVASGDTHQITISNSVSSPSWSPDSSRLAFQTGGELYLIDPDGRNLQQITRATLNVWQPAYSPVSEDILYLSNSDAETRFDILHLSDGAVTTVVEIDGFDSFMPYWSPNGQHIAFDVYGAAESEVVVRGYADVYVINLDGTGMKSVTLDGRDSFVGWSPDSKYIVYWEGVPGGADGLFYAVSIEDNTRILLKSEGLDLMCAYSNCQNIDIRPAISGGGGQ